MIAHVCFKVHVNYPFEHINALRGQWVKCEKSTPAGKRVGTYKTKELEQAGVCYPLPKRAFVQLGDAEALADGRID